MVTNPKAGPEGFGGRMISPMPAPAGGQTPSWRKPGQRPSGVETVADPETSPEDHDLVFRRTWADQGMRPSPTSSAPSSVIWR
jgi:hypothetical protein